MALLVQKFGGTSVASVERIQAVAKRICRCRDEGNDLVIVVSAMGHTTDELTGLAAAINPNPPQREMDMLLATGEQVSMALLAMPIEASQGFGSQATPEGVGQGVLEQLVTLLQRARLHRGSEQQAQEHLFAPGGAAQAALPQQESWQQAQAINQLGQG